MRERKMGGCLKISLLVYLQIYCLCGKIKNELSTACRMHWSQKGIYKNFSENIK
jgi:hypothetical protein